MCIFRAFLPAYSLYITKIGFPPLRVSKVKRTEDHILTSFCLCYSVFAVIKVVKRKGLDSLNSRVLPSPPLGDNYGMDKSIYFSISFRFSLLFS